MDIESRIKTLEAKMQQHKHSWTAGWWPEINVADVKWEVADEKIKITTSDKTSWYLNNKISVSWAITKWTVWTDIPLIFSTNSWFWDWSDWDITLNLWWWTYPLTNDVYNFNNVNFYSDSWRWTLITNIRTKPIIINVLWDFTLTNVDIDFSWKYNDYNTYTITNYAWWTLVLDWNKWWYWWWGWWWNSWKNINTSTWWCIRANTFAWSWATWTSWWWTWWSWINSGYAWWNSDTVTWNWKNWNSYLWWNWGRWYDAWCWLAWEWVWLWATTLWENWRNWSWTPSGWWWWAWWDWWKWWVSIILNVQWNVNIWSSVIDLSWWIGENWWNGWNGWNWTYSNWYWAWWWGWWGWWWAGWNWWWLYINYWWTLTFTPANFTSNWWAWWTGWSAWATEWTLPPYPKWWNWTTWTSWNYYTKKVINAF